MDRVAVLIPCYNEEQTVRKVVEDYRGVLPEADIYVYDNNSTDRTVEIATDLCRADPHVHLRHEYRQGKGNVIRTMFRDIDADCYLMIDGDDTYPAEHAPPMVQDVLTGRADMVIGDRLSATYFTENKRAFHNFGNRLVRGLINWLFGSNVRDIMTGYRAFGREFVKGFPVLSQGFEIETEMTIHAVDRNLSVKEIPVDYRDRPDGSESKLNTFGDGFRVLRTVYRLFKDYRPFAFFGGLAGILALTTLALFVPILIDYFRIGLVPRFPTLIVAVAIGVMAMLSFLVGVILDVEVQKHRQLHEVMINYFTRLERAVGEASSLERPDRDTT